MAGDGGIKGSRKKYYAQMTAIKENLTKIYVYKETKEVLIEPEPDDGNGWSSIILACKLYVIIDLLQGVYLSLKLKLKSWSIQAISWNEKVMQGQQMFSAIYYLENIKIYRFF